jgi:hypothetical protein
MKKLAFALLALTLLNFCNPSAFSDTLSNLPLEQGLGEIGHTTMAMSRPLTFQRIKIDGPNVEFSRDIVGTSTSDNHCYLTVNYYDYDGNYAKKKTINIPGDQIAFNPFYGSYTAADPTGASADVLVKRSSNVSIGLHSLSLTCEHKTHTSDETIAAIYSGLKAAGIKGDFQLAVRAGANPESTDAHLGLAISSK